METAGEVIEIQVNGDRRKLSPGMTLVDLLRELEISQDRVAIEYNRDIIRQAAWPTTVVEDGAQIEIVQFVGGG